ncbi:putative DNA binding domain-containing protein [Candidatus Woesearchaeota archaeon]|nr:putative DNA binding domain-containing protein [Candidatus Woesearchaeota archaeon]
MKESQTLEFKKSLAEKKEILETISAFANTKGGEIFVGIEENKDGTVKEIVGITIEGKEIENLTNEIKQNTDPVIFPSIETKTIKNKEVLSIEIKESPFKPVFAGRDTFIRVGKTNRRLSSQEIKRMAKESVDYNYTELICKEATLNDIDEEKVKWFLRRAKAERNFDVDLKTPLNESLERLKLMKKNQLTNAAILLFGKEPQNFFLQARIRCGRFKGTTAIDFIDMKLIEGNIIDQVDQAEKFILSHIKKAAKIIMFKREEVWEYPLDALREAIVNAVCHREYALPGNVKIAIFDDRIEISNPGKLPEPLTPSMLKKKHDSIPRNFLIANNFFLIRNIEQWGKGTNKIVKWCLDHGLKEPDFNEIGGGFEVVFYAPKDILKLVPEKGKVDLKELGLNERQIETLRLIVNENSIFTNKKYREYFKIGNATAKRDLMKLVKLDLVEKIGIGRAVKYKRNP